MRTSWVTLGMMLTFLVWFGLVDQTAMRLAPFLCPLPMAMFVWGALELAWGLRLDRTEPDGPAFSAARARARS